MKHRFISFIRKNGLIDYGDKIGIALSGGFDSVCMLNLFCEVRRLFGLELTALHVNHNIRGGADGDEFFVKNLCGRLEIPLYVKNVNIPEISLRQKISVELAARNERYAFFAEQDCDKVATAHNRDDNAETILMNLIRGSGKLTGIPVKRGNIIRPLLAFSRTEIISYLNDNNIKARLDETNLLPCYTRNKIRLNVMPEFLKINPDTYASLENIAELQNEGDSFIASRAADFDGCSFKRGCCNIRLKDFGALHTAVRRRIIFNVLKQFGLEPSKQAVDSALELKRGQVNFPDGYIACVSLGVLQIGRLVPEYEYEAGGRRELYIPELDMTVDVSRHFSDYEHITVRNVRPGDRLGKIKVNDIFADKRILKLERYYYPLICGGGGVIRIAGLTREGT